MIRAAIWAAVSSDEQARADKASIPNQIQFCREYAEKQGWTESAGPFIADGYSRSFYDGLSEAMDNIPALKDAMEAADKRQYDVLMCYYYERFGDITKNVFTRLSKYNIQFFSLNEPTTIVPPDLFDAHKNQTTAMLVAMSDVKNNYRISRIVLNLRDSMPKRIREGLTPARTPYGYKYINNKTPPELVPELGAKLHQARIMLLDGIGYVKIGEFLGVDRTRVPYVLSNTYYVGQVTYNKTFVTHLNRGKRYNPNPRSKWLTGQGQQEALFTQQEHDEIVAEIRRREKGPHTFVFGGILRCGVCGGRARRGWHGTPGEQRRVVRCRDSGKKHVLMEYADFYDKAVDAMQDLIRRTVSGEVGREVEDRTAIIRKALAEKQKRRRKIQEGYEAELYNAAEASRLLRELDKETEQLDRDLERIIAEQQNQAAAVNVMQDLERVKDFPRWLEKDDPAVVNMLLSRWLREIQVHPDGIRLVQR